MGVAFSYSLVPDSLARDSAIPLAVSLRIIGGIASHPLALLTLSILSSLSTALKHISWKSKGSLTVSQDRVVSRIEKAEGATPLHDKHHRVSSSIKVRHNIHNSLDLLQVDHF